MTLIEVLAGLALLATLLVSILLAKSRHTRQSAIAQRRIEAVAAADRLLAEWWKRPTQLPRVATGKVPDAPDLLWRTSLVDSPAAARIEAAVVRLEILDTRAQEKDAIVASVEVMVPPEVRKTDTTRVRNNP